MSRNHHLYRLIFRDADFRVVSSKKTGFMYKRIFFALIFATLSASVFSQMTIGSLYNDFANERDAERVSVGGLLMLVAKPFINKYGCGNISSVRVLSLEECAPEVKSRFNEQARKFRDKRYELFLNANDDDERTRIFLRFDKNTVREMVIISMGDEPALITLKGKIRPEDIERWMGSRHNEQ